MAYSPVPEGMSALDKLNETFGWKSESLPTLTLVIIDQYGQIPLITGRDGLSYRLPEGYIRHPSVKYDETVMDKVRITARTRTNATLGHQAVVKSEAIELVPFTRVMNMHLDERSTMRWPRATGKLFMPVIVPADIYGEDPQRRFEKTWLEPAEALETLDQNLQLHGQNITRSAAETIRVSMPWINEAIAEI